MAIVDVLDHLPAEHAERARIIAIFQATMNAVARVQDPITGVWYQVLDQADRPGNYKERA